MEPWRISLHAVGTHAAAERAGWFGDGVAVGLRSRKAGVDVAGSAVTLFS